MITMAVTLSIVGSTGASSNGEEGTLAFQERMSENRHPSARGWCGTAIRSGLKFTGPTAHIPVAPMNDSNPEPLIVRRHLNFTGSNERRMNQRSFLNQEQSIANRQYPGKRCGRLKCAFNDQCPPRFNGESTRTIKIELLFSGPNHPDHNRIGERSFRIERVRHQSIEKKARGQVGENAGLLCRNDHNGKRDRRMSRRSQRKKKRRRAPEEKAGGRGTEERDHESKNGVQKT
jgi:hypothetical protein